MKDFSKFFVISGCGWLLDVLTTMALVQAGMSPFLASMTGAGLAVTFVYVASLSAVFQICGFSGLRGYGPYILWQVFSISVASVLVSLLAFLIEPALLRATQSGLFTGTDFLPNPLSLATGISKALVTPLTLAANFLFMRWLTGRMRRSPQ